MEKFKLSFDLKEANEFCKQYLRHELCYFTHVLAEVLMETVFGPPIMGESISSIKNELKQIDKIRNIASPPLQDSLEEQLKFREDLLNQYLGFCVGNPRRHSDKRYKIASVWALAIKRQDGTSWDNIVRLLKWHYKHLEPSDYCHEIWTREPLKKAREDFKKQCSPYIENNKNILVSSMMVFFPNFARYKNIFSLQSVEFQQNCIRVGMTRKGFPGRIQQLTMESSGETKDYSYEFLDFSQKNKKPNIIFPNGDSLFPSLPEVENVREKDE